MRLYRVTQRRGKAERAYRLEADSLLVACSEAYSRLNLSEQPGWRITGIVEVEK